MNLLFVKPGITVIRMAGAWAQSVPSYQRTVEEWAHAALTKAPMRKAVSIVLADDAFVKDLNHTYRGKNKPTNVLSFAAEGDELGDVILAYETVKREAKEQQKSFATHAAHLVVHGCLHLLGYDHENDNDAKSMETLEVKILAGLGIPDPYGKEC